MSGLVDLIFLGLILWLVLRAAGKAAEGARGRAEGGKRAGAGGPGTPQPPGAPESPGAPEDRLRRRLMEELQRWEADQRRPTRRGVEARGHPAGLGPAQREPVVRSEWERGVRPEGRSLETIPPVEAVSLEEEPPPGATPRRQVPPTAAPILSPRETRPPGVRPGLRRRAPTGVGRPGRAATVERRAGGGLPDLSRYAPVQRAVVWAEILGAPPGLRGPAFGPRASGTGPPTSPPPGAGRERGGGATPRP